MSPYVRKGDYTDPNERTSSFQPRTSDAGAFSRQHGLLVPPATGVHHYGPKRSKIEFSKANMGWPCPWA